MASVHRHGRHAGRSLGAGEASSRFWLGRDAGGVYKSGKNRDTICGFVLIPFMPFDENLNRTNDRASNAVLWAGTRSRQTLACLSQIRGNSVASSFFSKDVVSNKPRVGDYAIKAGRKILSAVLAEGGISPPPLRRCGAGNGGTFLA